MKTLLFSSAIIILLMTGCREKEPVLTAVNTPLDYPVNHDWLKYIPDSVYITEITIPGTHDAASDHDNCKKNPWIVPVIEFVSCQTYNLADQMQMGVRFFDIRLRRTEGGRNLCFHHGDYYLEQIFENALDAAMAFLSENPSEFLIFCIKQEKSTDFWKDFLFSVKCHLDVYPQNKLYREADRLPTVGELRGKIMITNREMYYPDYGTGMYLYWPNNTKYYYGNAGDIHYGVQDHYSLNTVSTATKCGEIKSVIDRAQQNNDNHILFINFLSGEGDASGKPPGHYASFENPYIDSYICVIPNRHSCGILVMDYAGKPFSNQQLISTVINHNFH